MENLYYEPSGKVPFKGLIISLLIGISLTIGLSILYIALQWFIPFIYLNFFIAVGLGFGVTLSLFIAIGAGKIRNTKYAYFLATLCGLLAWYAQWALFVSLLSEANGSIGGGMWVRSSFNLNGFWYIFTHPQLLFQSLITLNEVGTFTLKHAPVTGILLWIVWIIEALIIIFIPILTSSFGKTTIPFSEQNDSWMNSRLFDGKIKTIADKETLIAELKTGNFKTIKDYLTEDNIGDNYATVSIYESPGDPISFLTVTNISHTLDKKGQPQKKQDIVVEYFKTTHSFI
ncbi:hypothetical protein H7F33_10610 [Pedobacter sp. PAMC26386]|nr:hypothetical protein H7F33_10610 [Pedobacter sp. PAMC26386]